MKLIEEKAKMLSEWAYYKKSNGEIDCVFNTRSLVSLYGSSANSLLHYMRKVHNVSILPIRTR